MEDTPHPDRSSDEFYLLKQGEIRGPFTIEALQAAVDAGDVHRRDFIQVAGCQYWRPLETVFECDSETPIRGAIAPDWKSITRWAWIRFTYSLKENALAVGLLCIAAGTLAIGLSRWPFLFWLPWFGLASYAAFQAMRRHNVVPGAALLVATMAVPLSATLLSNPRNPNRAEPVHPPAVNAIASTTAPLEPAPKSTPIPSRLATPEPPKEEDEVAIAKAEPPPKPVATPAPIQAPASIPIPAPAPITAVTTLPPIPPPQPAPPAASQPPGPSEGGDFVQSHVNSFVVIKDGSSSGSGFICRDGNRIWLYTNAHITAGMRNPKFTRLNGTEIKASTAEAAVGHDLVRYPLTEAQTPLELMHKPDATVRIGDPIIVLGNSGGGGVVTNLSGKLLGIGPDRIEVDAEFIPGNSGSPIIHVPTGKVIGIATYLSRRQEEYKNRDGFSRGTTVVRRFGYRMDSVQRWDPIMWPVFHGEAEHLRKISVLTADIFDFLEAIRTRGQPRFATETLRRPATDWYAIVSKPRTSAADRERATTSFLKSLRFMTIADVTQAENQLRYSYFREKLKQEREVRDQLFTAFDDEVKQLVSPTSLRR